MSEQIIKPRDHHNPYALIQAENAAMMEHIIKLQLVLDVQLKALKQQANEIEALRGFAYSVIYECAGIMPTAKKHKILDDNWNPTALLTGVQEAREFKIPVSDKL